MGGKVKSPFHICRGRRKKSVADIFIALGIRGDRGDVAAQVSVLQNLLQPQGETTLAVVLLRRLQPFADALAGDGLPRRMTVREAPAFLNGTKAALVAQ